MSTPLRRTPHRTKSEAKRQNILVTASALFLKHGFDGVSMNQVAIDAGVSKQTVYSHYGSKEELFNAIIEFKCAIHEFTDRVFDTSRPVHEVLQELAEHFSALLMSDEAICIFRVCIGGAAQRTQIAELFWKAGPQRLAQRFREYLTEQNRLGKIHLDNPHFAAQQFLYMIKAEAYLQKALGQANGHNQQELPSYLASCVAMFEKAYVN
ncbi:MAG: TetR/AcrR family transcriptional regulator [Pseudomonadales bacterium]